MAMILPFTTALPAETSYPGPQALPRQEMKAEKTDTRDEIRDRKELESSPDDDDFATIMGMLLGGNQSCVTAHEKEKSQATATAADSAAAAGSVESTGVPAGSSTAEQPGKGDELLTQAAALNAENNVQDLASEKAVTRLMNETPVAATNQAAKPDSVASVNASENSPAKNAVPDSGDLTQSLSNSMAKDSSSAPMALDDRALPDPAVSHDTTEFQPTAPSSMEAVNRFETAPVPDDMSLQTTFASAGEQLQSAGITPELLAQDRAKEARAARGASSTSESAVKGISAARTTSSLQPMASRGPSTAGNPVKVTPVGALQTDSVPTLFSTTGLNDSTETNSKIEQAMKSAEVSREPVTSDAIQDSLKQFWSDHSTGGSGQKPGSPTGESEVSPIGGTHAQSDVSRSAAAGATGATGQMTSLESAASVTQELRQPLSTQVSQAVLEHLEHQSAQKSDALTVRLDPPELGEMIIEISRASDGLAVRVTAREPVTMDMLLARGREIEVQLRGEKMDLSSLEFLSPGMSGGGSSQDQSSRDASPFMEANSNSSRRFGRSGSSAAVASTPVTARAPVNGPLSFRA